MTLSWRALRAAIGYAGLQTPCASHVTAGNCAKFGVLSRERSESSSGQLSPGGTSSPLFSFSVTLTELPGLAPYWLVKTAIPSRA